MRGRRNYTQMLDSQGGTSEDTKSSKRLKNLAAEEDYGKGHLGYNIMCGNIASRAVSDDKEIVGKDEHSAKQSPASTVHEPELSPLEMSDEEDCKTDIEIVEKDKDSENGYSSSPDNSDLGEEYKSPPYSPTDYCHNSFHPPKRTEEEYRDASRLVSSRALEHYNSKNGTRFEVVNNETIRCSTFLDTWMHVCFNAADSSITAAGSSEKLFFAELKYEMYSEPVVTNCIIVEGETRVGCENCEPVNHPVTHPVDGYTPPADGYRGRLAAEKKSSTLDLNYIPNFHNVEMYLREFGIIWSYIEEQFSSRKSEDCKTDNEIVEKDKDSENGYPSSPDNSDLGEEYKSPPYSPTDYCHNSFHPPERTEEEYRDASRLVSSRALEHYNSKNGTRFVVVNNETIRCSTFLDTWMHVCFNAADSSITAAGSSEKLFFAELKYEMYSEPVVTNCIIVEGETRVGCENCEPVNHPVTHPVDGYTPPVDGYRGRLAAKKKSSTVDLNYIPNFHNVEIYLREFNIIWSYIEERFSSRKSKDVSDVSPCKFSDDEGSCQPSDSARLLVG